MDKSRGFLPSRAGFPVSLEVAQKAWPLVSYTSSTGMNSPEPQGTRLLPAMGRLYDIRSVVDLLKIGKVCR